jgi:hypothetical protein
MAIPIKQPPAGESCANCKFLITAVTPLPPDDTESASSTCHCHAPPWYAVALNDWCGEWAQVVVVAAEQPGD